MDSTTYFEVKKIQELENQIANSKSVIHDCEQTISSENEKIKLFRQQKFSTMLHNAEKFYLESGEDISFHDFQNFIQKSSHSQIKTDIEEKNSDKPDTQSDIITVEPEHSEENLEKTSDVKISDTSENKSENEKLTETENSDEPVSISETDTDEQAFEDKLSETDIEEKINALDLSIKENEAKEKELIRDKTKAAASDDDKKYKESDIELEKLKEVIKQQRQQKKDLQKKSGTQGKNKTSLATSDKNSKKNLRNSEFKPTNLPPGHVENPNLE